MTYTVQIVLIDPPGPEFEEGLPCYTLPVQFPDIEAAEASAKEHIKALGRKPGEATWRILDGDGKDAGLS